MPHFILNGMSPQFKQNWKKNRNMQKIGEIYKRK